MWKCTISSSSSDHSNQIQSSTPPSTDKPTVHGKSTSISWNMCRAPKSEGIWSLSLRDVLPFYLPLLCHRSDVVQWTFLRIPGPFLGKQWSVHSLFFSRERDAHRFRLGRSRSRWKHWVSLIPSPFQLHWPLPRRTLTSRWRRLLPLKRSRLRTCA